MQTHTDKHTDTHAPTQKETNAMAHTRTHIHTVVVHKPASADSVINTEALYSHLLCWLQHHILCADESITRKGGRGTSPTNS